MHTFSLTIDSLRIKYAQKCLAHFQPPIKHDYKAIQIYF